MPIHSLYSLGIYSVIFQAFCVWNSQRSSRWQYCYDDFNVFFLCGWIFFLNFATIFRNKNYEVLKSYATTKGMHNPIDDDTNANEYKIIDVSNATNSESGN